MVDNAIKVGENNKQKMNIISEMQIRKDLTKRCTKHKMTKHNINLNLSSIVNSNHRF